MKVFKSLIAPLQRILLTKGMCPACTTPLTKGTHISINKEKSKIICTCGRIFIHDKGVDVFRRALPDEV